MVSTSDSQYTPSLAPSAPIASPPEEAVLSPAVSDAGRHSADLSPTFNLDSSQPPFPGPRHPSQVEDQNREQSNNHRHLPSLSDVFDGQGLPGGTRPSSDPNGYRFPGPHVVGNPSPPLSNFGSDGRPTPPANGQPYGGNQSSHQSFGQPRPAVDGPLPIHALLASKPEQTFHSNQPPHSHHGNHYHVDQNTRPTHQLSNGANGLPMINGGFCVGPRVWSLADICIKATITTPLPYTHTIMLPRTATTSTRASVHNHRQMGHHHNQTGYQSKGSKMPTSMA